MERDEGREAAARTVLALLAKEPDVRYAEVRFTRERTEKLKVRDGRPEQVVSGESTGAGVRILGARTWGFACTAETDASSLERAALSALGVARASSRVAKTTVAFPARPAEVGTYETRLTTDPFAVPLEAKLAELDRPVRAMLAKGKPVQSAEAWMDWTRLDKELYSTEGTAVAQSFTFGAVGMSVIAVGDDGEAQKRSYPSSQGNDGFQGGYERVKDVALSAHVDRVCDEVMALLRAPPCPEGPRDVVLESSQVALQIHESCGHPAELDRALGTEISLAGGSFLQPRMMGKLRYGSPLVNLVADATREGGMGTFGWDDEGIPGGRHPLVKDGLFVDYLSSRETAALLGHEPLGTMRADGYSRVPLIRMVNVSLEPGQGSLEDLVADTRDGVFIDCNKSWSIDDLRLNFQFSSELAFEIKNGKRTRLLKNPLYTGTTPEFWRRCDAIAGPEAWRLWGITNCGKGEPMQVLPVGHGASPARFRQVTVGSSAKS